MGQTKQAGSSMCVRPEHAARHEEERHRNLQDLGDVLQAARADAVHAILVFLHLLKTDTEPIAERRLTHVQHDPAHTYPAANMLVGGVRGFSWLHIVAAHGKAADWGGAEDVYAGHLLGLGFWPFFGANSRFFCSLSG
jgi:hypothetical protein